jgi:hypothetical protein
MGVTKPRTPVEKAAEGLAWEMGSTGSPPKAMSAGSAAAGRAVGRPSPPVGPAGKTPNTGII